MKILVEFKFLLILVTGCQAVVLREIISIREERVWVTDDDHGEATVCGPHDVDTKSWFFNWSPKNPSPMEQVTFNISMVAPVDFSHGKLQGYVILPGGQKAKLDYLFSCSLLQWKKCPIKKGDKIEAVKATRLPDLILEGKISVYANFYNDSGELALCLNATMSIGMTPPFLL